MASANDDQIKVSLTCAQQFKINVCRTAEEFKQLRTRLLQSLETIKSTNVRFSHTVIGQRINFEFLRAKMMQSVHKQQQIPTAA